jgi:hypothetical protein
MVYKLGQRVEAIWDGVWQSATISFVPPREDVHWYKVMFDDDIELSLHRDKIQHETFSQRCVEECAGATRRSATRHRDQLPSNDSPNHRPCSKQRQDVSPTLFLKSKPPKCRTTLTTLTTLTTRALLRSTTTTTSPSNKMTSSIPSPRSKKTPPSPSAKKTSSTCSPKRTSGTAALTAPFSTRLKCPLTPIKKIARLRAPSDKLYRRSDKAFKPTTSSNDGKYARKKTVSSLPLFKMILDINIGQHAYDNWHQRQFDFYLSGAGRELAHGDDSDEECKFAKFFVNVVQSVNPSQGENPSGVDVFFEVSHSARARLMERFVRTATMRRTGVENVRYSGGTMRSMLNEIQVR